jgi:hypothetical protein
MTARPAGVIPAGTLRPVAAASPGMPPMGVAVLGPVSRHHPGRPRSCPRPFQEDTTSCMP